MKKKHHPLAPMHLFIKRIFCNLAIGFAIIIFSLGLGTLGYYHFEKMNFIDAFKNTSMILSGIGPVAPITTTCGKIFAATYALFSGTIFLIALAIIISPIFFGSSIDF